MYVAVPGQPRLLGPDGQHMGHKPYVRTVNISVRCASVKNESVCCFFGEPFLFSASSTLGQACQSARCAGCHRRASVPAVSVVRTYENSRYVPIVPVVPGLPRCQLRKLGQLRQLCHFRHLRHQRQLCYVRT